jgi:hypothetical protein
MFRNEMYKPKKVCYIECSSKVSASGNKENRRELHFMCRMFVQSILTLFLVIAQLGTDRTGVQYSLEGA